MGSAARVIGFLGLLVAVFAVSFALGAALVPQSTVDSWNESAEHSGAAGHEARQHQESEDQQMKGGADDARH